MNEEPQPPFLVIREGQAFWIHKTPSLEALATLQAFQEGCFDQACCYDASGGLWRIVNATLKKPTSLMERTIPWRKVLVHLDLGPRSDAALEEVISRLEQILRDGNEFCEFSETPAQILRRFRSARTPSEIIQVALQYE